MLRKERKCLCLCTDSDSGRQQGRREARRGGLTNYWHLANNNFTICEKQCWGSVTFWCGSGHLTGSGLLSNGSGSRRPKNMRTLRIRIPNTGAKFENTEPHISHCLLVKLSQSWAYCVEWIKIYLDFVSFLKKKQGRLTNFWQGIQKGMFRAMLRIPDPDFYTSRIPDPKTATKRGVKKLLSYFFCSHKFHKIEYYLIFEMLKKKFGPIFKEL